MCPRAFACSPLTHTLRRQRPEAQILALTDLRHSPCVKSETFVMIGLISENLEEPGLPWERRTALRAGCPRLLICSPSHGVQTSLLSVLPSSWLSPYPLFSASSTHVLEPCPRANVLSLCPVASFQPGSFDLPSPPSLQLPEPAGTPQASARLSLTHNWREAPGDQITADLSWGAPVFSFCALATRLLNEQVNV